jgi:hypothetical protein
MRRSISYLLLAALLAVPPAASAQDPPASSPPAEPPPTDAPPPIDSRDASTPAYLKAVDLQRKGKFKEAQKAFRDLMAKYPDSVHALDCEMRGGDNCYMGCVKLLESGPPARRIDVSVMGDGFQIDDAQQKTEEQWARDCLTVLYSEKAYSEYENYFNFYFVRLVSKDEGVDEVLTDAQLKKREEDRAKKGKKRKPPKEFNTAIDCKAAGPQRQVMADHDLVYQWLEYANKDAPGCGDDGLVIAFAKFGELGMAELGNGLANCGRPSNSVTVHEFGHAFVGLLDEYANQPGPPTFPVRAPNATSDRSDVPWQHFIDKKWKGLPPGGVEGGATFKSGVWRPGPGCSMNSAGAGAGYCPPCREACVLRIYATVNPIDKISQDPYVQMKAVDGDASEIVVTPMQPKNHDLKCEWYVDRVPDSDPEPKRPRDETTFDGTPKVKNGSRGSSTRNVGRDGADYEYPPMGQLSDLGRVQAKTKTEGTKFVFPVGKLGRGRWQVTCKVWDPCEWVVKDDQRLLEERETFFVSVAPKK